MKPLRKLIDKTKPNFEKGGKYEKWMPIFESFETFLFVPGHVTKKGSHIRDAIDLKRTMIIVVMALVPALLFGMWNVGNFHFASLGQETSLMQNFLYGLQKVLPLIIVSYAAGLGVEFVFVYLRGHEINEGFLVSGMLIPLIVPVDVPLWMVAVATMFAVLIGKEAFGGTGMNIVNPALLARAFLFFAYPTKMSGDFIWISKLTANTGTGAIVDGFSGATPLSIATSFNTLTEQIEKATAKGDMEVVSQLTAQLEAAQAKMPSTLDAFLGFIPGSIGETSTLAILIGALILIITGIGSLRIMLSVFAGGYVMATICNLIGGSPYMDMAAHMHLLIGGFAFGAVFMATDPVTASQTASGKIVYGFLIGVMAVLIRVFNPGYPEGMMLAILLLNVFAPLIDHVVVQGNIKKRLKRVQTQ